MSLWVNRSTGTAARNGTTTHSITFTAATTGNLLVCTIQAAVTSTTPAGWTLPTNGAAVNNAGLYVWWKVSTGGETSLSTTHNTANYPMGWVVYEFPAGTAFGVAVNSTNQSLTGNNPTLSGITVGATVFATWSQGMNTGSTSPTFNVVWTTPIITDLQIAAPQSGTEGVGFSVGYLDAYASTSWAPTLSAGVSPTSNSTERMTFSLNPGAAPTTGTIAVTQADATASVAGIVADPAATVGTIAITQADATTTVTGVVDNSGVVVGSIAITQADATVAVAGIVDNSAVPISLYGDTLPTTPALEGAAIELGTKMTFSAGGMITGIRFPRAANATTAAMTGYVYNAAGTLLGSATIPTGAGWQTGNLVTPIGVTTGQIYTVSVWKAATSGPADYYALNNGLTSAITNGPISTVPNATSVNGVYRYGSSGGTVPTSTFSASNYYTDVTFSPPSGVTGTVAILGGDSIVNMVGSFTMPNSFVGTMAITQADAAVAVTGSVSAPAFTSIVDENAIVGEPTLNWFTDAGNGFDRGMLGFTTEFQTMTGGVVSFKINAPSGGTLSIYRLGWYGGRHARLYTTIPITAVTQPAPVTVGTTNERNCTSWTVNCTWAVPASTTGGLFLAVPRQGANASHIPFVIANQSQLDNAEVLVKTSDATWQAYNHFNTVANPTAGPSLYGSAGAWDTDTGRVYAASYDRPLVIAMAGDGRQSRLWNAEMDMLAFVERNGYRVAVVGCEYIERNPTVLQGRKAVIYSGHDEYWSQGMRDATMAARDHASLGSNFVFVTANEAFWRIRYVGTNYRKLICYKDSFGTPVTDPVTWTGTWRDDRGVFQPEEQVTGDWMIANGIRNDSIAVPQAMKTLPFWRNTGMPPTGTTAFGAGSLGFEWDIIKNATGAPTNLIKLSQATVNLDGSATNDRGYIYTGNGTFVHNMVIFKRPNNKLAFSSGTNQWSMLLGDFHSNDGRVANISTNVARQATVNLLADMGAQPGSLMGGLVAATNQASAYPWPAGGSDGMNAIRVGNNPITKVYVGTAQAWP